MITYNDLNSLLENCRDLLFYSRESGLTKEADLIKQAIRKVIIASEFYNKGLICVTGRQGAGKTTMMKYFYNIEEGIMNDCLGVGERIPIIISEKKGVNSIQLKGAFIGDKNTEIKDLSPDEFKSASCGDNDAMYLEINVPYTHFMNEDYSFMLLPGFEGQSNYWESLIDFSVKCSNAAIFVNSGSDFAEYDNKELIDTIIEKFGDNVIYALSHSDDSEGENRELKENCRKVLRISEEKSDRLVCVGAFADDARNDQWRKELKDSIEANLNSLGQIRENEREYICKLINEDIQSVLIDIKAKTEDDAVRDVIDSMDRDSALKAFSRARAKTRKEYKKILEKNMKTSMKKGFERTKKMFTDKDFAKSHDVHTGAMKRLKSKVFGPSVNDIEMTTKKIECALMDDDNTYFAHHAQIETIRELTGDLTKRLADDFDKICLQDKSGNDCLDVPTSNDSITVGVIHDSYCLLKVDPENIEKLNLVDRVDETMTMIARLAVCYLEYSLQNELHGEYDSLPGVESTKEFLDLSNSLNVDQKKIIDGLSNVQKTTFAFLGITGIDLMEDGVLNGIPKLAEALGVSVPIVAGAFGAIVAVSEIIALKKDLNRIDVEEYTRIGETVRSFYSQQCKDCLTLYDDAMDRVYERLEDNLLRIKGTYERIGKRLNAEIALHNLQRRLDGIYSSVLEEEFELGQMLS